MLNFYNKIFNRRLFRTLRLLVYKLNKCWIVVLEIIPTVHNDLQYSVHVKKGIVAFKSNFNQILHIIGTIQQKHKQCAVDIAICNAYTNTESYKLHKKHFISRNSATTKKLKQHRASNDYVSNRYELKQSNPKTTGATAKTALCNYMQTARRDLDAFYV